MELLRRFMAIISLFKVLAQTVSVLLVLAAHIGCERSETRSAEPAARSDAVEQAQPSVGSSATNATGSKATLGDELVVAADAATEKVAVSIQCPSGMRLVKGGPFWVGAVDGSGPRDEHPRFRTRVGDFCLDETEVTVADYDQCVAQASCTSAARSNLTCNAGRTYRASHPINCVTWEQAAEFCEQRQARLPTEVEWEYAARGGSLQQKYSWGNESPDGRACWKTNRTCPVRSFASGAFGLYDIQGNVWEWTASGYGPYPWPAVNQSTKVYRGGSWSRRFEKWMSSSLRNRLAKSKWGSHLGFRCAANLSGAECPYGSEGEQCLAGVDAAECDDGGNEWNGARCAPPGSEQCAKIARYVEGHGCVRLEPVSRSATASTGDPTAGVKTQRSPGADADCRKYQPTRPYAFKLTGGSHRGRNIVGQKRGCKNRDVGVGWNSACCPTP